MNSHTQDTPQTCIKLLKQNNRKKYVAFTMCVKGRGLNFEKIYTMK